MSVWTVKPESNKIELVYVAPGGQSYPYWIMVKRHLNVGEARKVMTSGWRGLRDGGDGTELNIDWRAQTFTRAEVYLTDWSLTDDNNRKLSLTRDTIESLHPELFDQIEQALNGHVKAMEQEKKVPSGSDAPSAT
jgi:hypothetical protein